MIAPHFGNNRVHFSPRYSVRSPSDGPNKQYSRALIASTVEIMLATGSAINSRLREAARAVTNRALHKDGREDHAGDWDGKPKVLTLQM